MNPKKVYLTGPISGRPREEYMAAFARAEALLKEYGYTPVNPTKFLVCRWPWLYKLLGYELALLYDIWRLFHCNYLYKLPGWKDSRGSNIEACAAYHMCIINIPHRHRTIIDLKMAKFMEKNENQTN